MTLISPPPPWVEDAVCAQTDPELFFPERGQPSRTAKAVCATCPVAAECLTYALEHGIREGIWGGTSDKDRRRMRRAAA